MDGFTLGAHPKQVNVGSSAFLAHPPVIGDPNASCCAINPPRSNCDFLAPVQVQFHGCVVRCPAGRSTDRCGLFRYRRELSMGWGVTRHGANSSIGHARRRACRVLSRRNVGIVLGRPGRWLGAAAAPLKRRRYRDFSRPGSCAVTSAVTRVPLTLCLLPCRPWYAYVSRQTAAVG